MQGVGAAQADQRLGSTRSGSTTAISQIEPASMGYSYRSASIGSSREALNAGYIPKNRPTEAENPRPIANDHQGSEIGKPEIRWMRPPMPLPRAIPSTPPSDVRNAASIRN